MQTVESNVPLAPRTTFQIGGPAEFFVDVRSDDEIKEAMAWAKKRSLRFTILAGGSNVLISDHGLKGLVIHIVGDLFGAAAGDVDSWAGTNMTMLINSMGAQGFGGWEKLAGIPGSIGGAVRGNAGAFGSEIKDFVTSVRALNVDSGELKDFQNSECDFSYRHSFFKDHPEWIITRVKMTLQKTEPTESARLSNDTIAEREKRHLQNVRAAGSFFMNPVAPAKIVAMFEKEKNTQSRGSRVPAGWLIEKAGLKGKRVGDAEASVQHPNYLVNVGNATAHDVRNLAQMIKMEVAVQFGVELQEEAALL